MPVLQSAGSGTTHPTGTAVRPVCTLLLHTRLIVSPPWQLRGFHTSLQLYSVVQVWLHCLTYTDPGSTTLHNIFFLSDNLCCW